MKLINTLVYKDNKYTIINGDCLEELKKIEDESIDSIVTDPPAGIAFMGKDWDKDKGGRDAWITWMAQVASQCFRCLKPGGHALVWGLPRTSHWTATAWENAGFEVRDIIVHIFGSGFPKSSNISKRIDKEAGAERKTTGNSIGNQYNIKINETEPATPDAIKWNGWGTALKPASEHWILLRKPIEEKTIAKNVVKYGTGAINIDECRIGLGDDNTLRKQYNTNSFFIASKIGGSFSDDALKGRWPANVIHDGSEEVVEGFPTCIGSASRFFYCAKTSSTDRNEGCEELEDKKFEGRDEGQNEMNVPQKKRPCTSKNNHPTVKPNSLMTYLCRLITPPGGIVLDPFMGSGSTGKACMFEGFRFIGIEQNKEYCEIAEKRISFAEKNKPQEIERLFD